MKKFKLKICTFDNEPVVKAKADQIKDFDPIIKSLKQKYGEGRGK